MWHLKCATRRSNNFVVYPVIVAVVFFQFTKGIPVTIFVKTGNRVSEVRATKNKHEPYFCEAISLKTTWSFKVRAMALELTMYRVALMWSSIAPMFRWLLSSVVSAQAQSWMFTTQNVNTERKIIVVNCGKQNQLNALVRKLWRRLQWWKCLLHLHPPAGVFPSPPQPDFPSCLVFLPRVAEGAPLNWDQAD